MVENNNLNSDNYKEEMNLVELCSLFWNNKKNIACIIACFMCISAILSIFVIKPTYETDINMSISMPEKMNTKYGELTLPIETNLEYLKLFTEQTVMKSTAEDMGYGNVNLKRIRKKFEIPNKESNVINIKVIANSPEEAVKLANVAYENYKIYLDLILKNRALAYFEENFSVSIEQNNSKIINIENSLERDKQVALEVTTQINNSILNSNKYAGIDYVALGESLGYAEINKTILQKEQEVNKLKEDNAEFKKYLQEIEAMNKKIQAYYETEDRSNLKSENFDFVSQNIQLLSKPMLPNEQSKPNIIFNLAISLVIGCMCSVFFVMIKECYSNQKKRKI